MTVVALGLLGTTLDAGSGPRRWGRWRPSVSMFQHPDLLIDRLELLHERGSRAMADTVCQDIQHVSPSTEVRLHEISYGGDAWDFERVYGALHDFATGYDFFGAGDDDDTDYLVHITTGTHVAQICLFLLTEARYLPARLIQTSPPQRSDRGPGSYRIIDLDLSRYDQLFERFEREHREGISLLKAGIATRNEAFNRLIEQIERVALNSQAPILLTGPTGAGKTQLARRIVELRRARRLLDGALVEVNCATLRGDQAMSALFGHRKGAFTGAVRDRPGLLKAAHGGCLFLDEIGELGLDEQAMLLRAIEAGVFMPVGADEEDSSDFQLIAGTNRDLRQQVADGEFREDLLARINLWEFRLPGLRTRLEDLEPNLDYELEAFSRGHNLQVSFNREARRRFLDFAASPAARWSGNFRDLNAAVTRMATLCAGGRINEEIVAEEIARLQHAWDPGRGGDHAAEEVARGEGLLRDLLGEGATEQMDRFDRVQLADAVAVCARSRSLSDAGRELFAYSRTQRKTVNDADRLRKYLARHELSFEAICQAAERRRRQRR